jgi:hypothetical protein
MREMKKGNKKENNNTRRIRVRVNRLMLEVQKKREETKRNGVGIEYEWRGIV